MWSPAGSACDSVLWTVVIFVYSVHAIVPVKLQILQLQLPTDLRNPMQNSDDIVVYVMHTILPDGMQNRQLQLPASLWSRLRISANTTDVTNAATLAIDRPSISLESTANVPTAMRSTVLNVLWLVKNVHELL
ncbi:unnamed protein product [Nippostrongylus brasiliensis]|uniref:Secreted protein n=1 Tax=Nippostrongylus brasiliensis TaxID=27835 RepID=A0A0N4XTS8_NIPBR|nr:unnamed protein product [Nippostrongylus brasiliensis]